MPNRFIYVATLGAVFSLAPFGIDMYLPALPTMAKSLAASIDDVEASVSIFLLGYALSQLVFGPLSDRFGRLRVLQAGLSLFVIGSALCAIATDVNELYGFRFVQALGGGASVVVFPLIKDRFDEKAGAQIISYIMAVVVIAPLVAPLIGGYILVTVGWPAIFVGLGVYGAFVMLAVQFSVKPTGTSPTRSDENRRFGLIYLLEAYRDVLTNVPAMAHILAGSFAFAGLFAFVAGSPFVYITYFGVPAQHYGYLVGLNALVMIAMNLINARLLSDMRATPKAIAGAGMVGVFGVALFAANAADLGLIWIVAGVAAYFGALGLVSANAIAGALAHFSAEAGAGSAMVGVFNFGLGAISSMVISALHSTDATALVSVMAGCGLLALASVIPLIIGRPGAVQKNGSIL